jgi:hypothetical protein
MATQKEASFRKEFSHQFVDGGYQRVNINDENDLKKGI